MVAATSFRALVLVVCPLLLWVAQAGAQPQPRGPAELIGQARKARESRELQQAGERGAKAGAAATKPAAQAAPGTSGTPAAQPVVQAGSGPGTAAPAGAAPADPHAGLGLGPEAAPEPAAGEDPHAGMGDDAADAEGGAQTDPHAGLGHGGEPPPLATAHADPSLPTGTIRVRVIDASGAPAAGAEVSIGEMKSDNTHSTQTAHAGADGIAVISGLASGERQAYRVNVPYQGAKYSSTPFRLPPAGGYQVEIRRLPTTRDSRLVVLYLGATSLELKDDRIKVVQEAQLLNIGNSTYVFPEAGVLVPLPKGFMAMQSQKSMTDQHVVEAPGQGLRVHGSLPPGQAELLWGFDLPLSGSEAHLTLDIPWLAFAYRVIADAPEGMSLEVAGMPEATLHTDNGRRFWVTETQRKVGDPPLRSLQITLRGIPGPGPARWIAALLALGAIAAGVVFSRRGPGAASAPAGNDLEARKAELIERARALQALRDAGEAGPEYHAEQMGLLTDELAALLFEQAELKRRGARKSAG